jgi:hypothetical protein
MCDPIYESLPLISSTFHERFHILEQWNKRPGNNSYRKWTNGDGKAMRNQVEIFM